MKYVIIGILAFILAVAGFGVMFYVSAANTGNVLEKGLTAQLDVNKNTRSQYVKKIQDAAKVPAMQRDDLTAIIEASLEARYGDDGAKAMFQMITESNPNLDQSTYLKMQNLIASGRDEFKTSQDVLIDKKRVYETELGYLWTGMWLRLAGYPKIDLAKIRIVTDTSTEKVFESGREDDGIKLR